MNQIHISEARRLFSRKEPLSVSYITAKGELQHIENATPLKANFYAGIRNFKLPNGQIRKVRDNLIVAVNQIEVYL